MVKSKVSHMKLIEQAKMEARGLGIPQAPICYSEDDEIDVVLMAWEINTPESFDWAQRTLTGVNGDFIFGVGLKDTERGVIHAAAFECVEVMEADSFEELLELRDARQYELYWMKKFGDEDFVFNPANHQMAAIVLYRQQI